MIETTLIVYGGFELGALLWWSLGQPGLSGHLQREAPPAVSEVRLPAGSGHSASGVRPLLGLRPPQSPVGLRSSVDVPLRLGLSHELRASEAQPGMVRLSLH